MRKKILLILILFLINDFLLVCLYNKSEKIYINVSKSTEVCNEKNYTDVYIPNAAVCIECKYEYKADNTEYTGNSVGTGIIIAQNESKAYIITNNHVIKNSNEIKICDEDKLIGEAEILMISEGKDIALLSVEIDKLNSFETIVISEEVPYVGQIIYAYGNALGEGLSLTKGVISAINKKLIQYPNVNFLQVDAAINEGCSGGMVINQRGELVGIICTKISEEYSTGISYIISSTDVLEFVSEKNSI